MEYIYYYTDGQSGRVRAIKYWCGGCGPSGLLVWHKGYEWEITDPHEVQRLKDENRVRCLREELMVAV